MDIESIPGNNKALVTYQNPIERDEFAVHAPRLSRAGFLTLKTVALSAFNLEPREARQDVYPLQEEVPVTTLGYALGHLGSHPRVLPSPDNDYYAWTKARQEAAANISAALRKYFAV